VTAADPRPGAGIELCVLDVDGVLTDGRLWFDAEGEALKVFHVRDGLGIKLAQRAGIEIAVLSGRRHDAVARRMAELGVRELRQGVDDKVAALGELLRARRLDAARVACLVDDTSDLPLLDAVGFGAAVADAHAAVRAAARYVTRLPGGHGAVRELCDLLVAARGPTT
jgi:3-deoxy-D-manno-octulosonate 8-phosphate phosphatase (KDO 8-P phosphatase)